MKEITIKSGITICFVFAGRYKEWVKCLEEKFDEEEEIILDVDNKIWIIDISDKEFHNDEIWKYDFAIGIWEPTKIAVYLDDVIPRSLSKIGKLF